MKRVLAIAVVLLSSVLMADVLVHKVSDGDTVWVTNDDGSKEKVRLNKIDAPEMNQPYGKESADRLAKLILGKKVKLEGRSKDRYGRTLSEIYLCSTNINLQLVKEGLAWHYREGCEGEEDRTLEGRKSCEPLSVAKTETQASILRGLQFSEGEIGGG